MKLIVRFFACVVLALCLTGAAAAEVPLRRTHASAAFVVHSPTTSQGVDVQFSGSSSKRQVRFFGNAYPVARNDRVHVVPALVRQRKSVASVQMMGLFGLGIPEIAIILVGVAVVLGPDGLKRVFRSAGEQTKELSKELKAVPEEFKKGLEEGEINSRARNAKQIKKVEKVEKESTDE